MSEQKQMTEMQIASKLKAGKRFQVPTAREQKMALTAAKYLGVEIKTESIGEKDGPFVVKFIA